MLTKKSLYLTGAVLASMTLAACGGSSSSPTTVTPPPPPPADTTAPAVSFSPATLSLNSGASGSSTLSATDAVGVTSGPDVNCTNGGVFSGSTFTAPVVTTDISVVCTATAGDAAGNSGSGTLTVTVTAPAADNTAPVLSFTPATLTVASSGTASSTLSATDNVGVTVGPDVSCTNGGAYSAATNTFTAPAVTADTSVVCTATAQDAAGNSGSATLTATVTAPTSAAKVALGGKITFDSVPFNTSTFGLDYNAITMQPVRGVVVEALNASDTIVASGETDAQGNYSLDVDASTELRVRAKAQLLSTQGATWDTRVIDNTSGGALYAITGSLASTGTNASQTRDLNAPSGWGGSSYTSTRSAGPFAILSPIYTAHQKIAAVDADVAFPPVNFNWSVNNRPASGSLSTGAIGTSFYSDGQIYILGAANSDTDEYDTHVVTHEWGHYFEDRLSRSHSIGGNHGGDDKLDPRVAFSEGFGNALSGIVLDDSFYRDSSGSNQSRGFFIDVEQNETNNEGWFNETSTQAILYDLYDSVDDGADTVALGIGPIYEAFTSSDYINNIYLTTIFSFIDSIKTIAAAQASEIDALLTEQSITVSGSDGAGETNDGNIASVLPLYKSIGVGTPASFCLVDDAGTDGNKLGNTLYLKADITNAATYTLTMTLDAANSSDTTRDPDFDVYKASQQLANVVAVTQNTDSVTLSLTPGEHIIAARDYPSGAAAASQNACYTLNITQ